MKGRAVLLSVVTGLLCSIMFNPLSLAATELNRDSLMQLSAANDSGAVLAMIALSKSYTHTDTLTALHWAYRADSLAGVLGIDALRVKALKRQGIVLFREGKTEDGFEKYAQAAGLLSDAGKDSVAAEIWLSMSNRSYGNSLYTRSIEYAYKALHFFEINADTNGIVRTCFNIGNVEFVREHYKEALSAYQRAEKNADFFRRNLYVSLLINNIGNTYKALEMPEMAMDYLERARVLFIHQKEHQLLAMCYNSMGEVMAMQGRREDAMRAYTTAMDSLTTIGYKNGMDVCHVNMGKCYLEAGEFNAAIAHFRSGHEVAVEIACLQDQSAASEGLSKAYAATGQYRKAYDALLDYYAVKSQIISNENEHYISELQASYNSEKKELKIKALQSEAAASAAEITRKQAELSRQRTTTVAFAAGFALMLAMVFVILNSYRRKKRDNAIITVQKKLVEEKNKEILDSINYAQRLQDAMLPPPGQLRAYLGDVGLLYLPKDIVAGDFYWMERPARPTSTPNPSQGKGTKPSLVPTEEEKMSSPADAPIEDLEGAVLLAAADCTGHGVPGAMVSVVCHNALNRAVREYKLAEPGRILDKARELVAAEFEKSEEDVKDGMDISLCALNGSQLQWAGANNPLWIVRPLEENNKDGQTVRDKTSNGTSEFTLESMENVAAFQYNSAALYEVKGNKQHIGKTENPRPFKTHSISLKVGDCIYLFSDGLADQFGGPKGKKLMKKSVKKFLLSVSNLPMQEQMKRLGDFFNEWKAGGDQVDDVCVIGMRI